jgi:DMSO/TMAO reductase YedYZ molybdopterin-dependent catalytic subunit
MSKSVPYFQHRRERRGLLRAGLAVAAGGALAGCDAVTQNDTAVEVLRSAESLTMAAQRALGRRAMAQEFAPAAAAPVFRVNGTSMPAGDEYAAMRADGFSSWRLKVDGLVARPLEFTLAQLHGMPSRTQVTRHDCVEGWSCIGQWTGVPLSHLLGLAGLRPSARYIVFHCLDRMEADDADSLYYESIGLRDAFHPQSILAWDLNGQPLPVENGAPLRARIERQLGYKMPKYVHRIQAVASFADIRGGRGGYWEDLGYNWYAGI